MPVPAPPRQGTVVHVMLKNGVVTFVGSNSQSVSGHAPGHFEGRHVRDLVHPDDLPRIEVLVAPGWTGRFSERFRVQERDGVWTWRQAEGVRTVDAAGEPRAIMELRKIDPPQD
jgi:PAS domain S-box-containing protein